MAPYSAQHMLVSFRLRDLFVAILRDRDEVRLGSLDYLGQLKCARFDDAKAVKREVTQLQDLLALLVDLGVTELGKFLALIVL